MFLNQVDPNDGNFDFEEVVGQVDPNDGDFDYEEVVGQVDPNDARFMDDPMLLKIVLEHRPEVHVVVVFDRIF